MGIRSVARALHVTLPPTQKVLLLSLADLANDAELCWPSVKTLAKKCQLSRRTIQRASRRLESCGLINVLARRTASGGDGTNIYALTLRASE